SEGAPPSTDSGVPTVSAVSVSSVSSNGSKSVSFLTSRSLMSFPLHDSRGIPIQRDESLEQVLQLIHEALASRHDGGVFRSRQFFQQLALPIRELAGDFDQDLHQLVTHAM